MKPFIELELDDIINNKKECIKKDIEKFSNEEIMENDFDILSDNLYQEYHIDPITILNEDGIQEEPEQIKVKKYIMPFYRDFNDSEYVFVDGIRIKTKYMFTGDEILFKCTGNVLGRIYPDITLKNGYFVVNIEKTINELKKNNIKEELDKEIKRNFNVINIQINNLNDKVERENVPLKDFIVKCLKKKKDNIEIFYNVKNMLEIPIEKKDFFLKEIPLTRKVSPIKHTTQKETYYGINNKDYYDILDVIKQTMSTCERTPITYKSMKEEDLRNILLNTLNTIFRGMATGETFRNKGKTDICIEMENRAAFIGECKIWNGKSGLTKAIEQLDSYTTWRDCKTSLIYFVRKKDFMSIINDLYDYLKTLDGIKDVKKIDENEYECLYLSHFNLGQILRIRLFLFNL